MMDLTLAAQVAAIEVALLILYKELRGAGSPYIKKI